MNHNACAICGCRNPIYVPLKSKESFGAWICETCAEGIKDIKNNLRREWQEKQKEMYERERLRLL